MPHIWDYQERTKKGVDDPRELYVLVGEALSIWEQLEYRVALIFSEIIAPGSFSYPGVRAFGRVNAGSVRNDMAREAVRAAQLTNPELKERILDKLKEVGNFGEHRNNIAHGYVGKVTIEGADLGYVLRPASYNAKRFPADEDDLPRARYLWGPAEVGYYIGHFTRLRDEVEALNDELRKHGAEMRSIMDEAFKAE